MKENLRHAVVHSLVLHFYSVSLLSSLWIDYSFQTSNGGLLHSLQDKLLVFKVMFVEFDMIFWQAKCTIVMSTDFSI